jgi:hypothetical protein
MLPDSGASRSVFPRKYARPLGIDILKDCSVQKVDTGNGIANQHMAPEPLKAWVAGREIELCACFGNIGVPVLGREDFFAEFLVLVDEVQRLVTITPHP